MNTHLRDNLDALRAGGLALSSQATADFLYASSATQLGRLAAVTGKVPRYSGSAWEMVKTNAVAHGVTATTNTSTSGSYADTNLTVSITTQTAASKVLVALVQTVQAANGDGQSIRLLRGATELSVPLLKTYGASDAGIIWQVAHFYVDTPGSAAAHTYKTQHLRYAGSGAGVICQPSTQRSDIVVLELEV